MIVAVVAVVAAVVVVAVVVGAPGARVRPSTNHWVSYQPTSGYLTNQLLGILPTDGLVLGFRFTVLVLGFSFSVWF